MVEEVDGVEVLLAQHLLSRSGQGSVSLDFVTKDTAVAVHLSYHSIATAVLLDKICVSIPVMQSETYLVEVCDEEEDRYRFGYNGMHKDNEWAGVGNSLDFGVRIYDSRLGCWLSPDPLFKIQPSQFTYKAFLNNPIIFIDPEGETEFLVINVTNYKIGENYQMKYVVSNDLIEMRKSDYIDYYRYYDIYHTYNYTIFSSGEEQLKISYNEVFSHSRARFFKWVPQMTFSDWTGKGGSQKSGYYMTAKDIGGQDATKFHSLTSTEHKDVNDFLHALQAISKRTTIKGIDLGYFANQAALFSDIVNDMDNI